MGQSDVLQCPPIDEALVEHLERVFRTEPVTPGKKLDEMWYEAGQQKVIDWLRMTCKHQQDPKGKG